MKVYFPGSSRLFVFSLCLLSCIFSFLKRPGCQDLASPRFFTFDIQSLSGSTSPVIPQTILGGPTGSGEVGPSLLYQLALRFPIKMKGKTRLFGEIAHRNEYFAGIHTFDADEDRELEALELFQTSGSLILMHQFNERWKLVNVLRVHSNSSRVFDLGGQALGYTNVAMLEKKVPKGTLGFGGLVSINQRISLLPVFRYEARLGGDWGLDILLPSRVLVTRNFSKRTRLSFGLRADAATYFLNGSDGLQTPLAGSNFRRINLNGVIGVERQISPLVGFRAEMGASLPYQCGVFDFDQANLGLHDFQNRVSPHLRVGVFLSLPK